MSQNANELQARQMTTLLTPTVPLIGCPSSFAAHNRALEKSAFKASQSTRLATQAHARAILWTVPAESTGVASPITCIRFQSSTLRGLFARRLPFHTVAPNAQDQAML